ncbi:hypothetical protein, variant [Aphanomyces invadans]|uniref:EF-hand domain-containing protein n=1 Tax=Aphanomyces invadans TaxID=157072 RepID=A0A024TK18_9STRA|nr:hypothetical protein, variant [Aphanomyces invadans]ETV94490.1 hypothetical protein, variant [Aphanomyces invadans]|eukprot:XP_008876805.1 hypothetical protein, variant [Aphanomyces invadans]
MQRNTESLDESSDPLLASPPPAPLPQSAMHAPDLHLTETWVQASGLPRFTMRDAQNMEWDYSKVTWSDAASMARNNNGRRRSSLAVCSEFGDAEQPEKKEDIRVLLDPFYDVTTGRLRRLFHHFSPNGSDVVKYDDFQRGLHALGISVPSGESFADFVAKVDTNGDGLVSVDEFVKVVQMIKQAHLFKPEHASTTSLARDEDEHVLRVVDYSPTSLRVVDPVTKLQEFMLSSKPDWATVRWVHLAGFHRADDLNLRRLAIKYQLHPLALEDCLNPNDKIRCKFEHYDDHSFLVVPVLRALSAAKSDLVANVLADRRDAIAAKKLKLYATDRDAAMLRPSATPSASSVRAANQAKATALSATLDALDNLLHAPQQISVFVCKDQRTVVSVQDGADTIDGTALPLWDVVFDQTMAKSYSKVRNHSAPFLVVSILNAVVDDMMPLVAVMEPTLKMLGKLVRLEQTKFDPARLARAKKQLIAMEKVTRPILDLVTDQLFDHAEFNQVRAIAVNDRGVSPTGRRAK